MIRQVISLPLGAVVGCVCVESLELVRMFFVYVIVVILGTF